MDNEKYTQKALTALQNAQQNAALRYHQEITSAHLLLSLITTPEGILTSIYQDCHTDLPMLQARLEKYLNAIPAVQGQSRLSMATEMIRVLGLSLIHI